MRDAARHIRDTRRVFYLLTVTRWAPVGFVISVFPLLALERGLSVQQTLTYSAGQGVAVLLLELPTSGFADVFGRKPVLVAAGCVNILTGLLYLSAATFWQFALAAASMGVYRALDSGPLEAWFVDTVRRDDPGVSIERDLARQGTIVGLTIGVGALLSGGLVAWHPVTRHSALIVPVLIYTVLAVVHLTCTATLVQEPRPAGPRHAREQARRAWASAKETPAVIRDGLRLLRCNRVLAGVVGVEVFWVCAMAVFESAMPVRLAQLVGGESAAGSWMGPIAAGGWLASSLGSLVAARAMTRCGVARSAMIGRIGNGLGAALMGLTFGPAALVAAYWLAYSLHGFVNAPHAALLHREANNRNRATVLSLNSMVAFGAGAAATPLLGIVARLTTLQTAMISAGLFSVIGAALYWPAWRSERRQTSSMRAASSG